MTDFWTTAVLFFVCGCGVGVNICAIFALRPMERDRDRLRTLLNDRNTMAKR